LYNAVGPGMLVNAKQSDANGEISSGSVLLSHLCSTGGLA